jgi:hypothetical protein
MPDDTEWTRWGGSLTADGPVRPQEQSVSVLARTISRVQRRDFDLIALPAIQPQHAYGQRGYKLVAKSVRRGAPLWCRDRNVATGPQCSPPR